MNTLLLIVLVVCEMILAAMSISKNSDNRAWRAGRFATSVGQLLLFLVMLILPGIDLGLRFKVLFALLVFRVIWAAVRYLIARRKLVKEKGKVSKVVAGILASILILIGLLPSYIFADYQGLPTTGEYTVAEVDAILVDEARVETFETDGSFREVPIYMFYPQELPQNCPVVLFSHGAFGYYQSNASTYMELASHGYVVISVEHPYHSMFTHDTDGKMIMVNSEFMTAVNEIDNMSEAERLEMTGAWMDLRCKDINFVIDTVKASKGAGSLGKEWVTEDSEIIKSLLAVSECDKFGLMGHSLGGASSVEIGRERSDIAAVIDYDGTMLGEESASGVRTDAYQLPILCFDNQEHHDLRVESKEKGEIYANNVLLDNAVCGYETYFKNTEHMDFTDLPLFSPVLGSMLGSGPVDKEACVNQMNDITRRFFDCYMKGTGNFSVEECYEFSESGN